MVSIKKLSRSARRVFKGANLSGSRPVGVSRRLVPSDHSDQEHHRSRPVGVSRHPVPSYHSYQEYHRTVFGLADHDSSDGKGPLAVRNPRRADSITRWPSDVVYCPLHDRTWEKSTAPQAIRSSLTIRGLDNESADNLGSQSGGDRAPAQMNCCCCGPWTGVGSLSTIVEETENSDEEHCSQRISQPFLSKRAIRMDAPAPYTLKAGRPVRADDPFAFLHSDDNEFEMVDNQESGKLNAKVEAMNNRHHKVRRFVRRTLNKIKSIKVVPTTLSNPEKPSRWSVSPISRFRRAFRSLKNHLQRDNLNRQTPEPIELPASPPGRILCTNFNPMPFTIVSPSSPRISSFAPPLRSIPTSRIPPSSSYDNALLHPGKIPDHVLAENAKRRLALSQRRSQESPSNPNRRRNSAETAKKRSSFVELRVRLLKSILERQMEETRKEVEQSDKFWTDLL